MPNEDRENIVGSLKEVRDYKNKKLGTQQSSGIIDEEVTCGDIDWGFVKDKLDDAVPVKWDEENEEYVEDEREGSDPIRDDYGCVNLGFDGNYYEIRLVGEQFSTHPDNEGWEGRLARNRRMRDGYQYAAPGEDLPYEEELNDAVFELEELENYDNYDDPEPIWTLPADEEAVVDLVDRYTFRREVTGSYGRQVVIGFPPNRKVRTFNYHIEDDGEGGDKEQIRFGSVTYSTSNIPIVEAYAPHHNSFAIKLHREGNPSHTRYRLFVRKYDTQDWYGVLGTSNWMHIISGEEYSVSGGDMSWDEIVDWGYSRQFEAGEVVFLMAELFYVEGEDNPLEPGTTYEVRAYTLNEDDDESPKVHDTVTTLAHVGINVNFGINDWRRCPVKVCHGEDDWRKHPVYVFDGEDWNRHG